MIPTTAIPMIASISEKPPLFFSFFRFRCIETSHIPTSWRLGTHYSQQPACQPSIFWDSAQTPPGEMDSPTRVSIRNTRFILHSIFETAGALIRDSSVTSVLKRLRFRLQNVTARALTKTRSKDWQLLLNHSGLHRG